MNRNATFRHEVQFYSSDSALLESFARFIRNALKSHTAVVVLATKSHRESLVQRLSGEDFDIDCAMQHGMYISLEALRHGTLRASTEGEQNGAEGEKVIGHVPAP